METWMLFAMGLVGLTIVVLVAVFWARMAMRGTRSERLREQYGSEYEHTLHHAGSRDGAEQELEARQQRVSKLELRRLPQEEARRISRAWLDTQSRFVDAPAEAINQADGLVAEVMELRGYPIGDFEERAADVSVDHPALVANYRHAHGTALRNSRGAASTEEMREAMVQYRDLFTELLETRVVDAQLPPRPHPADEEVRGPD